MYLANKIVKLIFFRLALCLKKEFFDSKRTIFFQRPNKTNGKNIYIQLIALFVLT